MVSMYASVLLLYCFVILEPISTLGLGMVVEESENRSSGLTVAMAMAMKSKVVKKSEEKLESASTSESGEIYPLWPINISSSLLPSEWSKSKKSENRNNSGESLRVNSSEEKKSPLFHGKLNSLPQSFVNLKIFWTKFQRQSKNWKFGKGVQNYAQEPISQVHCKFHGHQKHIAPGDLRPMEYSLSLRTLNQNKTGAAKTTCRDLNESTTAEFRANPLSQMFIATILRNRTEDDLRLICESSTLILQEILQSSGTKQLHCSLISLSRRVKPKPSISQDKLRMNSWVLQDNFLIANLSWPWPKDHSHGHEYFHLTWEKVGSGIAGNLVTDENTATITLDREPGVYSIQVIILDMHKNSTQDNNLSALDLLELLSLDSQSPLTKPGKLIGSIMMNTSQAQAASQKTNPNIAILPYNQKSAFVVPNTEALKLNTVNSSLNNFTIVAKTKIKQRKSALPDFGAASSESDASAESLRQSDHIDGNGSDNSDGIIIVVIASLSVFLTCTLIFLVWLNSSKLCILWSRREIRRTRF